MLRYAAGRNHARILNANFFLYSYHRPSPLTHYSTSETILTGPLSNGSSTRKGKKSLHKRPPHDSLRDITSPRSKGTAPRSIVHAQARPYARLLRVPDHLSSTVSPRLAVSIPMKSPSFPSIPSDFTPRSRSILSPDPALCARRKHPGDGK